MDLALLLPFIISFIKSVSEGVENADDTIWHIHYGPEDMVIYYVATIPV